MAEEKELANREPEQISEKTDDAPKDVRGAIRAALEKHSSDGDTGRDDRPVRKDKDKRVLSDKIRSLDVDASTKDSTQDTKATETEPKEGETVKPSEIPSEPGEKKEEIKEPDIDPPPYWRNKSGNDWSKIPKELKQAIVAREKEVSDGFAQVSPRLQFSRDMEQVIAPRLQAIQQFGVSPAQTVDRLFQWMEALSDPRRKLDAFKALATSFGVPVNQLSSNASQTEQTPDPDSPPEWFHQYYNGVNDLEQQVRRIDQSLNDQRAVAAQNVVLNWAKDKPYYQQVAPLMGQLIASGAVPLKEGNADLDGAYAAAVKIHPEVSAQIQKDEAAKTAKAALEKAQKEAKDKAERLEKAKRAGVGFKPASPSSTPAPLNSGKKPKSNSVRESIMSAIESSRE